jgi:ribonuclease Z
MHMDHFIGFDTLIRIFLGRERTLFLYGPPGFTGHVEGRLSGYTWNLVHEYETNLFLQVSDIGPDMLTTRVLSCRDRFNPQGADQRDLFKGIVHEEPAFRVESECFDHKIPCLGFSLIEHQAIHVIREAVDDLGLDVGPWLNRLKAALHENKPPESPFRVTWESGGHVIKEKTFSLGDLAGKITRRSPGRKLVYITDMAGSDENLSKASRFARGADILFVEAAFLDEDRETARRKYHLTAKQAGNLARRAEVKTMNLFHFSPRYTGREEELIQEARAAFEGT